jgi:hypothetical protein
MRFTCTSRVLVDLSLAATDGEPAIWITDYLASLLRNDCVLTAIGMSFGACIRRNRVRLQVALVK